MGNCIGKQKQEGERKNSKRQTHVEGRRRSFSRRLDPWEKTGMVAFRSSHLKVRIRIYESVGMIKYLGSMYEGVI